MISSAWRKWRTPLALGLALAGSAGVDAALAQFYFRPFVQTFRYDLPPEDDDDYEAPRFASRRAVARILAREGFQLVGPLGHRGEQIVAMGVNPREGETRFVIDPYEGAILHAVTVGPPPPARPRGGDDGFVPQLGGSHPVVRDIGRDRNSPAEARIPDRSRRSAARAPERDAPPAARPERREAVTPPPASAPVATPAPSARPQRAKPAETAKPQQPPAPVGAAKPIEWAKPAEIANPKPAEAARPADAAKPADTPKSAETPKAPETTRPLAARTEPPPARPAEAKPVAPAPKVTANPATAAVSKAPPGKTGVKAPAPKATAARSTGGSSYRAIVPPKAAEGTTVVTPSTPATATAHSPAGAMTPQGAAVLEKKD